jgi:hypothetical protein
MKTRTLLILVAVLAILVIVAGMRQRKPSGALPPGVAPDTLVLAGVDINLTAQVLVNTATSTSRVEKKEGKWVVPTMYGYPADFDRLARYLRALAEMKGGQEVRGGMESLEEFGLAESNATRVVLRDAGGQSLAELTIGAPRTTGSRMGGQYLRLNGGPVLLVKDRLDVFPPADVGWVREDLLVVSPDSVSQATIATPGQPELEVRSTGPGSYTMDGLAKDEAVDTAAGGRLFGAFQFLNFTSVTDPSKPEKDLGLENPARLTLKTRDGFLYSVLIGASNGANGRYARARIESQPTVRPTEADAKASIPAPTNAADTEAVSNYEAQVQQEFAKRTKEYEEQIAGAARTAEERNAAVKSWTYVLPEFACANMTATRDQLVQKIDPSKPRPSANPPDRIPMPDGAPPPGFMKLPEGMSPPGGMPPAQGMLPPPENMPPPPGIVPPPADTPPPEGAKPPEGKKPSKKKRAPSTPDEKVKE